jgi:hypothetical protein
MPSERAPADGTVPTAASEPTCSGRRIVSLALVQNNPASGMPPGLSGPPWDLLAPDVAARIASGAIGDARAFRGYVGRARGVAIASLVACVALVRLFRGSLWLVGVAVGFLLLGAGFDRARARLAASLAIDGAALRVVRGPWTGLTIRRGDVLAVGFGAPGREGRRAPETFWRGDYSSEGESHVVCLRLAVAGGGPSRLIVPEGGRVEARAAVHRLRAWVGGRA